MQRVVVNAVSNQHHGPRFEVQTHLYRDVEHESWFPCVSHAHHSDPVGIANTHLLGSHSTQTHTWGQCQASLTLFHCHPDAADSEHCRSDRSGLLTLQNMEGKWSGVMETYESSARTSIARGPIRFKATGTGFYRQNSSMVVYLFIYFETQQQEPS